MSSRCTCTNGPRRRRDGNGKIKYKRKNGWYDLACGWGKVTNIVLQAPHKSSLEIDFKSSFNFTVILSHIFGLKHIKIRINLKEFVK